MSNMQPLMQPLEYRDGDALLEGGLVDTANSTTPRPGVLMVPDFMGIRPQIEERARSVADLGYVVLVADIYGKEVRPQNMQEARDQITKYRADLPLLRGRAAAGLRALQGLPQVDAVRVGAMGYCFGGGVSLELARSGASIAGAISIHGTLGTPNPADAANIKGKILVLHGADDPHVPPEQVAAFQDEMRAAGVDYQIVIYGGAMHSFTDPEANRPENGSAYNREAAQRSREATKDFWAEVFGS